MVLHEKYAKEPWRHIGLKVPHHIPPPSTTKASKKMYKKINQLIIK